MKCPHCDYSHGEFKEGTFEYLEGEFGSFYEAHQIMSRRQEYSLYSGEREYYISQYGCPKCKKTFID